MRKRTRGFFTLTILLLLTSLPLQGQQVLVPLSQIFTSLEKTHQIQFNYAEDIIKDIRIKAPVNTLSLNDVLLYLEKNTNLSFERLSTNFVLVKTKVSFFVCGYITDSDTGYPLGNVTVQAIYTSAISDANGYFELSVASEKELILIRHIGYTTQRKTYRKFSKGDCEPIALKSTLVSLSEVVLSNYITSGIHKINDGSLEINFSNFGILPGLIDSDVLQSVQSFPGIISSNETVSAINIRGGTNDQNLILWDNIKMYQSGHFFGLISMYNPQITNKVSLRKNGSDVSYTDGVSGTIEMYTNTKVTTDFTANIGMNLTDVNGFVDFSTGQNSSLQIAARKSTSNFFETPTYKEFFSRISQDTEVENNTTDITNSDKSFDFYDTSLRWLYKPNATDEIRINFINVSNKLLFNENAVVNGVTESRESQLTQNSIAGSIRYKKAWSDKFSTIAELYETDYKLQAINANIIDAQRFLQENVVSETSFKLMGNYVLNDNIKLMAGGHFVETGITNLDDVDNPIFRVSIAEVIRTYALFSQMAYTSEDYNTHITLGVRGNYIGKFKRTMIEPRFTISQRFLDNFTVEMQGEMKHQNTSQIINFQNDFLGIEKRRWQLSNNNDIPVISSKQLSAGLNYSNNGWLLSAEGYYKKVDGITSQSQGFKNQHEFIKTSGSYTVNGFDILLRKNLSEFNTWISYSYMNNNYTFTELETTSFPSNFDLSHAVTIGTAYTINKLKLSAGVNWHTGKPTTLPIAGNELLNKEINYGTVNDSNLEEYLRVDFSALYDFQLNNSIKANIGISVWNVLDRENEINNFYSITDEAIHETIQRSLGITPNAVIRLYF